jgi:hypothetical protein
MLSDGLHSEQSIVEHRAVTVAFYVRASELPAQRLIAPRYQPVWPVPPAQQQTKATAHTGRQAGRQAGRQDTACCATPFAALGCISRSGSQTQGASSCCLSSTASIRIPRAIQTTPLTHLSRRRGTLGCSSDRRCWTPAPPARPSLCVSHPHRHQSLLLVTLRLLLPLVPAK